MKKLSDFIKDLRPSELSRLRGMRQKHSSRDKQRLLNKIIELEEALKDKCRIIVDTDNKSTK